MASTWLVKSKLPAAEGLTINGNLACAMTHHQRHLTVSELARVEGNIHAGTVVVFGQLIGDIFSEGKVLLARGSDVHGDISCNRLYIEDGAQFMGRVLMGKCDARADQEYS
jgi:cytoskeletal protein CcmA (bactofilin family)